MGIADRIDQDVEGWRPEDGEKLVGKVLSVEERPSDYGDDYPYLEVETPEGEVKGVHGFHTVLKNELAAKKPLPGDDIAIKYFGKVTGKKTDAKGRLVEFEKYRVLVEHNNAPAPAPNWDGMKADAEEEAKVSGIAESFGAVEEPF